MTEIILDPEDTTTLEVLAGQRLVKVTTEDIGGWIYRDSSGVRIWQPTENTDDAAVH